MVISATTHGSIVCAEDRSVRRPIPLRPVAWDIMPSSSSPSSVTSADSPSVTPA